jgi:hypothetical protein
MSRVRMLYALACAGILITTGGCAGSATAPEAATAEQSAVSAKKAPAPAPAPAPDSGEEGDGDVSIQSGFISGGSRAQP